MARVRESRSAGLTMFRDLPTARQGQIETAARSFGQDVPALAQGMKEQAEHSLATATTTDKTEKVHQATINRITRGQASGELSKPQTTSIDAGATSIGSYFEQTVQQAHEHRERTGELKVPDEMLWYGHQAQAYNIISRRLGLKRHSSGLVLPESFEALTLAGPQLSPRANPNIELRGAQGMGYLQIHGEEHGVDIGEEASRYLRLNKIADVAPGAYSLAELPSRASAAMTQAVARNQGVMARDLPPDIVEMSKDVRGSRSLAPGEVGGAAVREFSAGMGLGGNPKGGRALQTFRDPEGYLKKQRGSDQLKAERYSYQIQETNPTVQRGIEHALGIGLHGAAWIKENPDAGQHIAAAMQHPGWDNATSTSDVWHSKGSTGLNLSTSILLGERLTPDKYLQNRLPASSAAERKSGVPIATPSQAGYLAQEEATTRAIEQQPVMHGSTPESGPYTVPAHAFQAGAWFPLQRAAKEIEPRTKLSEGVKIPPTLQSLK